MPLFLTHLLMHVLVLYVIQAAFNSFWLISTPSNIKMRCLDFLKKIKTLLFYRVQNEVIAPQHHSPVPSTQPIELHNLKISADESALRYTEM